MYRKRMSEALQEARAYTAVNEVMVFKGGRGMNVSKKDLPVFRAKGWELKEKRYINNLDEWKIWQDNLAYMTFSYLNP